MAVTRPFWDDTFGMGVSLCEEIYCQRLHFIDSVPALTSGAELWNCSCCQYIHV